MEQLPESELPSVNDSGASQTSEPAQQMEQAAAGEIHIQGNLTMSRSAAMMVQAGNDIQASNSVAGAMVAGRGITLTNGGAGAIVAGSDVTLKNGGAQVMVVGRDVEMHTGAAPVMIVGRSVTADRSFFGVVFSNQITLGENSQILLSTPQAVAFGAALGVVFGLFYWLFKPRK